MIDWLWVALCFSLFGGMCLTLIVLMLLLRRVDQNKYFWQALVLSIHSLPLLNRRHWPEDD